MKTPPFLIGVALLFWGWQTHLLALGALAGAVLESARWLPHRWELTQSDLDRIWNFCVLLFFGAAVYAFASNDGVNVVAGLVNSDSFAERTAALNQGARSAFLFFQWSPLPFLPIALAQAFGQRDQLDWSTFSWWLRRQRIPTPSPGLRVPGTLSNPLRPHSLAPLSGGDAGLNVLWPFFTVCLLAASAANERTILFPAGLAILTAWALWTQRAGGTSVVRWGASWLAAIALGLAWYGGLLALRGAMQRLESELVAQWIRNRSFDAKESATMLGAIGRLKLSGRIVLRLESNGQPPSLLREASYSQFRAPRWSATKREFVILSAEKDETTWRLRRTPRVESEVSIARVLPRGEGLLALPLGSARLEDLPAFVLETNRLGAVRIASGPGFVHFRAGFNSHGSFDSPPDADDLDVPPGEQPALAQVVGELKLAGRGPDQILRTVGQYFASQFRYSTWLDSEHRATLNRTALAKFLLENHSGHCEYFATATVLLLREAGIPARYAVGYAVQEKSGNEWIVRERHAHAWCLAWVNGAWREIDNTPASWGEIESSRASAWEAISDLWSRIRFVIAEWRWSKGTWKRYAVWLLIPLLIAGAWRLFAQKQWKRVQSKTVAKAEDAGYPGHDSEFYSVERRLAELTRPRAPGETPAAWIERTAAAPPSSEGLVEILALHYRLRFDPSGFNRNDRVALRSAAQAWLNRNRSQHLPALKSK